MSKSIPKGRFETLTKEEERKLKLVWAYLFKFWGTPVQIPATTASIQRTTTKASTHSKEVEKPKKKLFGRFRSSKKDEPEEEKLSTAVEGLNLTTTRSHESIESSYRHKDIHDALKDLQPQEISDQFWDFLRTDYPDNLVLRFVRARKWDVDKSLAMLAKTLHWRIKETNTEKVLRDGDRVPIEENKEGMVIQLRKQKAYMRGVDKFGRPIVIIRPRLHFAKEQSQEDLENYVILVIEMVRMSLKEPHVDSAAIIFDLSDFTTSNMDYNSLKFLIGVFEAHYPESLGKLFIHKAPWIFPPIWNIVKNWLDPVVASKITFTKNAKDLEEYIDIKHIPESLGGEDKFDPTFIEPNAEDDKLMSDTEAKEKVLAERQEIIDKFVRATVNWIESENDEDNAKFKAEKLNIGKELAQNFIKLDPYVRTRNYYDRNGSLKLEL
ncbi:hypothetical protein WICPIJ_004765 [Wickerhamomyces pijperi]|uniref:CRAL-TRIO domain-containing protein n=1 Tax=Wickerhamomyces pijperi TaxID=599730 RepID=A0A9P8Q5B2_WICPI|nr:hypothetical protein WICPIJ_004765 [Wickerhamomyces pijperi]